MTEDEVIDAAEAQLEPLHEDGFLVRTPVVMRNKETIRIHTPIGTVRVTVRGSKPSEEVQTMLVYVEMNPNVDARIKTTKPGYTCIARMPDDDLGPVR